jgi:hypothetical protein
MTDVAAPNERDPEIHEAFLTLACAIFCFSIERVTRINSLKVRFLGDKVPERTAWKVARSAAVGDNLRRRIRGADAAPGGRFHYFRRQSCARCLRPREDGDDRRAPHCLIAALARG